MNLCVVIASRDVILPSQGEAKMAYIDLRCLICCSFSSGQILAIATLASQGEAKMTPADFHLSICSLIVASFVCDFSYIFSARIAFYPHRVRLKCISEFSVFD